MSLLRLKEILKKKNITGKDLAEELQVSQNTISNIVNGYNFPKPELLKGIAEALDVDIRSLFYHTKLEKYDQIKHEQLVKIVNVIEGKEWFNIRDETISISELTDHNDIRHAIALILDVLHVRSGSAGEYDLYRLLEVYLTDTKGRKEINEVLDSTAL